MTPADIESFVNSSPTWIVTTLPEVGYSSAKQLAFYAVATIDKLAVFTGQERGPDTFVYSSAGRNGDVVTLKTVRPFPAPTVLLMKADEKDEEVKLKWLDGVDDAYATYDDNEHGVRAAAQEALDATLVWEQPPLNVIVPLVEWADVEDGEVQPKGVLYFPKGSNKLAARTFPGYEEEAQRWSRFQGEVDDPAQTLEGIAFESGSRTLLSDVRMTPGSSEEDAASRALYLFASRDFLDRGRRLYG